MIKKIEYSKYKFCYKSAELVVYILGFYCFFLKDQNWCHSIRDIVFLYHT